jgi:hypothetical protein
MNCTNKNQNCSIALVSIAMILFLILILPTASANKYISPEMSTETTPSLCVHNSNLYVAWEGKDNHRLNVAQVNLNGDPTIKPITGFSNKVYFNDMSKAGPSLASFNGRLFMAWEGAGNGYLNVMYSTDGGKTFGNKYVSPEMSTETTPVLCVHNGNLYIAWEGKDNHRLNVAQVNINEKGVITGFSNKVYFNDMSKAGPSLASFNGRLFMAWEGAGNGYLNVMYSTDGGKTFGNKYISPEMSTETTPALCVRNGNLYIAWEGKDNHRLNIARVEINGNSIITGFSNKDYFNDMSKAGPSLASLNDRLFMAWEGAGNGYLNVMTF